jgi:hypothetical protein
VSSGWAPREGTCGLQRTLLHRASCPFRKPRLPPRPPPPSGHQVCQTVVRVWSSLLDITCSI